MKQIRIASRASKLAMIQTEYVRTQILNLCPELEISIVKVFTKGDRDKSDFMYKAESTGLFTSEVEKVILEGRADVAVHSLKDLPTAAPEELIVAAIPERGAVADALVALGQVKSVADLPSGATVGTSSLRRMAQLRHIRSDLNCVPLRGNVETRVRKVNTRQIDAAVVACAALNRLGLADVISAVLPPDEFLPAPAQGALAVQIRAADTELFELVSRLDDKQSRIAAETERHILAAMHGGCSIPLGAYARIEGDTIKVDAMICDIEGKKRIRRSMSGSVDEFRAVAEKIAQELLAAGGQEIVDQVRKQQN